MIFEGTNLQHNTGLLGTYLRNYFFFSNLYITYLINTIIYNNLIPNTNNYLIVNLKIFFKI